MVLTSKLYIINGQQSLKKWTRTLTQQPILEVPLEVLEAVTPIYNHSTKQAFKLINL